ncbi:TPA: carbohydrate porin, partial [Klebsiella pneumoniae]
MKVNYMALIMSGLFSSGLWAAANNHPTDIEKRLAQLEQRVINAEQRAADAEAKIQTLTRQQNVVAKSTPTVKVESAEPVAPGAEPTTLTLSGYGDIKFYGDVEFN